MSDDIRHARKKTLNILMVEDDDVDARVVEKAFLKERILNPLYRARDGIEALDMLRGTGGHDAIPHPYIILVDLNMPRMGGVEFIEELRRDKDLQQSVAFILTTSKREEDKAAAYRLNVAGYILKENIGRDFIKLVDMLDHYWRIVEVPS